MPWTTARKRTLYLGEAVAILFAALMGLHPSLLTPVPLLSLPALVLAVVSVVRPSYLDRRGVVDPRRVRRRYLHASAGACFGLVVFVSAMSSRQGDLPRIGIAIENASSGRPMFRFSARFSGRFAYRPWDRRPLIYDVSVLRNDDETVCELSATGLPGREPGDWRYGTPVAGYDMEGCAPLEPGRYLVAVDADSGKGFQTFNVPD